MTNKYDAPAAYAQSKLANLLFARELGKRLLGKYFISLVSLKKGTRRIY